MPESLVIRCPHCNHALNVPEAFLGQVVTCLECRAPFRAPVREGGALTAPTPLPKPSRIPARLFVPTFGLMLLGFAGLFVNLYLAWWFRAEPQAAAKFAEANMLFMMETEPTDKAKDGKKLSDEEEKQRREQHAEKQQQLAQDAAASVSVEKMTGMRLAFAAVSLGVLLGGLCFVLKRGYYYCYFACLLAALNSPDIGCCFVGVVVGAWGFMALISEDGQRYFSRAEKMNG